MTDDDTPMPGVVGAVSLRDVRSEDLDTFFEFFQDAESIVMAAFTPEGPSDRDAFDAHWDRILAMETVTMRTVEHWGEVVGHVGSYSMDGEREVTYWIGQPHWGSGVATEALRRVLDIDTTRPIRARVVKDNLASIRVLEKCGFVVTGSDEGFAHGGGEVVEEFVMTLAE